MKKTLFFIPFIVIIGLALVFTTCKKEKPLPPTASFTVNPTPGYTGTAFEFDASGSKDNSNVIPKLTYSWDFNNDGTYEIKDTSAAKVSHIFGTAGNFTVKLKVTDRNSNTDETTKTVKVGKPTVTTDSVTSITSTTAICGGNVTDDGGVTVTSRGVCWSTSQNPTIANTHTTDGTGTGSFTSSLTGLSPNTTYYVRAYASNSAETAYGNEINFITCTTVTFTYNGSSVTYGTVLHNGKCWLDRNLGASEVATSSTDTAAYGDLFQWGRLDDGHQIRTSDTTSTLSSTDVPGHSNFIFVQNSPYDWRSPQNGNLWQGVNGINNPCPSGYRLPTEAEWDAERASWGSDNAAGAFASPLKLPVAGCRLSSSGSLGNVGSYGDYWSSTVDGTNSRYLDFNSSNVGMNSNRRAYGFSVRCIKD